MEKLINKRQDLEDLKSSNYKQLKADRITLQIFLGQIFHSSIYSENEIEKAKENKVKSLDDVLLESVGKWGWFQVWFFGLVINFYLAAYAPGVYGAMYTDFKPKHHCAEDDEEIFNLTKWENEELRKENCHMLGH